MTTVLVLLALAYFAYDKFPQSADRQARAANSIDSASDADTDEVMVIQAVRSMA